MYKFNDDAMTTVPACALIEDAQELRKAIVNGDWDAVQTELECLCNTIEDYTSQPESMNFKPSESSLIAMSCQSGVITREDGSDILCAAGKPVSEAMFDGLCQCGDDCPYRKQGCAPDKARIMLPGYLYEYNGGDEELLEYLEKQ